jgi:hypothetical protein
MVSIDERHYPSLKHPYAKHFNHIESYILVIMLHAYYF